MEPIRWPRVLDATPHRKVELLLVPFTRSGTEVDPTLEAVERDDIIHVLKRVNGKVAGRDGAAAKLGMKRTTFQSCSLLAPHSGNRSIVLL
jgi:transcriptional regulator with GAF, ATPase, and Fis domain